MPVLQIIRRKNPKHSPQYVVYIPANIVEAASLRVGDDLMFIVRSPGKLEVRRV